MVLLKLRLEADLYEKVKNLHSNMVLLKWKSKCKVNSYSCYLHSNMVLLKLDMPTLIPPPIDIYIPIWYYLNVSTPDAMIACIS